MKEKDGVEMNRFATSEFCMEYTESEVGRGVLFESHCHTQLEMIAVLEGDITVTVEGKGYRLKRNQGILIPPLAYHAVTAAAGTAYRRITVLFGGTVIPGVLQPFFGEGSEGMTVGVAAYTERLRGILLREDPDFYSPLAKSMMVEILYDAIAAPHSPAEDGTDDFLKQALLYIEAHLHEKILLDDLARHTARSKSSFCHLFEKRMNVSPKQYILQKKIAVAQKLIGEGVPHTAAALRVGYENYSSFYRLLKKHEEGGIL